MTELFCKLFRNPAKALLLRAFTAVATVAVCLAAMVFTVYAYFSGYVTSSSNKIQTASFTVTLAVASEDADASYSCAPVDAYTHKLSFAPGVYTVTVARSGQSTASTGYCKITVDGSAYFTRQFNAGDPALTFTLQLTEEQQLTVSSRWGTYANHNSTDPAAAPYLADGAVLCLGEEVTEPAEPEVTEPEITEPEVTEAEDTEPEITEPEVTEAEVTEPEVTEPEVTEPEVTEPEVTEPEVTKAEDTEPEITEPEITEPEITEPEVTEPEETQALTDK